MYRFSVRGSFFEKKQRHVFYFLSFSSHGFLRRQKEERKAPSHVVSIKLPYQKITQVKRFDREAIIEISVVLAARLQVRVVMRKNY